MNNWNRIFKPIVVLGVICVIVTGALAATNGVTAPIIQAATEAAETAARTEQAETKGIGSNVVSSEEYWANYAGVSAEKALVLNQDVNAYTGATISSKAVLSAVNAAIDAYNQLP